MFIFTGNGRLAQDPVVVNTESGFKIVKFTLVSNKKIKDKTITTYQKCKCFGSQAELVEKYCSKGKLISISGQLLDDSYENKEGVKIKENVVEVSSIDLGPKPKEEDESASPY